MALSETASWLFPLSVLGTSVIASSHCLGMCGPLIFTIGSSKPRLIAYHSGRLLSYVGLGWAAGAFGKSVFSLSTHPLLSGLFLALLTGLLLFLGWKTFKGQTLHITFFKGTLWQSALKFNFNPIVSSGLTGLMSIFLPCGHLYTFALGATATGSAVRGAAMMFAFWLGTLPALGFGVHILKRNLVRLGPARYRIAALVLVTTGLLSLGNFAAELYKSSSSESPKPLHESHSHSHSH